jgi:hypothetical protein
MIIVTVTVGLAKLLHQYEDINHIVQKKKYTGLINWLQQHHANLMPSFPDINNADMQTYFTLQAEREITDAALTQLQNLVGIQSAYRKPEDSLPM